MSKKSIKVYDFSLSAGGSTVIYGMGEYFRIQSATGALDVTVEGIGTISGMLTGQAVRDTPYSRIVIKDVSGSVNSGTILCSGSEFMDNRTYGVNSLDTATIASIRNRPEMQTGSFADTSALVANTPITIFTPAANVNGALLLSAALTYLDLTSTAIRFVQTFVSSNVTPAGPYAGAVLLQGLHYLVSSAASTFGGGAQLAAPQFIGPGQGLYFVSSAATTVDLFHTRSCRYKLL